MPSSVFFLSADRNVIKFPLWLLLFIWWPFSLREGEEDTLIIHPCACACPCAYACVKFALVLASLVKTLLYTRTYAYGKKP